MTTSKVLRMLALPLAITLLLYACSKDSSIQQAVPPGQQKVSIFLTDDPAFFDQVLVDIQSVAVQVDTCEKRDRWNDDEDEDHHHQSNETLNPKAKIQESLDDSEDEESSLGGEEPNVISCEDPEFSDFDKLREKRCFEERQVWALYDEGEGMPRFYAVIRKVTKPSALITRANLSVIQSFFLN